MDHISQDLRDAVRAMRRNRGVSASIVLVLALGIGATTTIFSAVSALLLGALPFPDASRLMSIEDATRSGKTVRPSYAELQYWTTHGSVFQSLAGYQWWEATVRGERGGELIFGAGVSPSFFATLGVEPSSGRDFQPGEDQAGHNRVVIVGRAFADRTFGSARAALGKPLTLDGLLFTVIGVARADAAYPSWAEAWVPLTVEPTRATNHNFTVIGRLRPGVSVRQAAAVTNTLVRAYERAFPDTHQGWSARVLPLAELATQDVRPLLTVLLGAVVFVLLIACANAANLLLVRATGQRHDISIRVAMGARHGRLVRRYLVESVLLASLAATLGVLLAEGGIQLFKHSLSPDFTAFVPGWSRISIDARTLVFTTGTAILTGIAFGMLPALRAARNDPATALRVAAPDAGDPRGYRVRRALMAGEIALALVLLVAAGLMMRSFVNMLDARPGFRLDHVLTAGMQLPEAHYTDPAKITAFDNQLLRNLRALPGVRSAGLVSFLPLSGSSGGTWFTIPGRPGPAPGEIQHARWQVASPGYFEAMGIPAVRGRLFNASDGMDAPQVALINETMARRYWPGESPIGARIGADRPREIVGVVRDTREQSVDQAPDLEIFAPQSQAPTRGAFIVIHTAGDPAQLSHALEREVATLDPDVALVRVQPMMQVAAARVSPYRLMRDLLGMFAILALTISAIGLYSHVSYSVSHRRREIGIRLATGAAPRDILHMILRQGLATSLLGAAVGLAVTMAATRVMASVLFGISATDTTVLAAVSGLLVVVALFASLVPARRAARVNPMEALRYE